MTMLQPGETTLVFVYGTLRRGEPNHHRLLNRARFVGEARTEPKYELMDLGPFPALVAGGATAVLGEVYTVDARVLADLDRLEGHPRFYHRTAIRLDDGVVVQVYLMPGDRVAGRPRIVSGDWSRREEERGSCASAS